MKSGHYRVSQWNDVCRHTIGYIDQTVAEHCWEPRSCLPQRVLKRFGEASVRTRLGGPVELFGQLEATIVKIYILQLPALQRCQWYLQYVAICSFCRFYMLSPYVMSIDSQTFSWIGLLRVRCLCQGYSPIILHASLPVFDIIGTSGVRAPRIAQMVVNFCARTMDYIEGSDQVNMNSDSVIKCLSSTIVVLPSCALSWQSFISWRQHVCFYLYHFQFVFLQLQVSSHW